MTDYKADMQTLNTNVVISILPIYVVTLPNTAHCVIRSDRRSLLSAELYSFTRADDMFACSKAGDNCREELTLNKIGFHLDQ